MIISIITILGLVFRLILANQSFWLDEGASIEIASRPFLNLISSMVYDFHPPLYYLLLKAWLPLSGHTEWLIRLPNILIGVVTIPVVYLLTKEISGKTKGFFLYLPALLLAINPFHIYYSQELRMYGSNTLLTALSWLFLLRLRKESGNKNGLFFTLVTVLNLYTFYGAFFNLFSQLLFTVWDKNNSKKIYLWVATSILFFLPWLPVLNSQLKNGGYLTSVLPGWSALSGTLTLKDLFLIPTKFLLGRINLAPKILYAAVSGASFILLLIALFFASKNKKTTCLWFYLLVPLFLAVIISLKTPVLGYWRYTSLLPALLILISFGLEILPKFWGKLGSAHFIILFMICNIIFWSNPTFRREDWRGLANFVSTGKSLIVLNYPAVFAPLKFYLPKADYYFSETSLGQERTDLNQSFSIQSNGKDTVYLLDYLSDLTDPQRTTLAFLKSTSYRLTSEKVFNGLGRVSVFQRVK